MARNTSQFGLFIRLLTGLFGLLVAASCLAAEPRTAAPYEVRHLNLGIRPLAYPSGTISAVMRRDRILGKALFALGRPLQMHSFKRGTEMLKPLAAQRLEAGLMGDQPTLLAASAGHVWIVGLVRQSSTAIVARSASQVAHLVGKRIAFSDGSSGHRALLQGLASARLHESDVKLVAMNIDAMPEALARGEVDAFAASEPIPSIALQQANSNRVIFRGRSADYFVIEQNFANDAPQASQVLIAGYLRAIEWMRQSQKFAEQAAQWAMADALAYSAQLPSLTIAQIAAITRREILTTLSAPVILINPEAPLPLKTEFDFLKANNKLPAGSTWENVEKALHFPGLPQIMAARHQFGVDRFDYDDCCGQRP